jgi:hypothetical protein
LNVLAWEAANTTYVIVFVLVAIGLVGIFVLASWLRGYQDRRRVERKIAEIEKRCSLTGEETDFLIHISNKNELNVPITLFTHIRAFDSLVGKELEALLDSAAPLEVKQEAMSVAYSARRKLFPEALRIPADGEIVSGERHEEAA